MKKKKKVRREALIYYKVVLRPQGLTETWAEGTAALWPV